MPRMTPYALFAIALVAFPTAALAQEPNTTASHDATIQPIAESFYLSMEPSAQRIQPGGDAEFQLVAKSRVEQALSCAVHSRDADGLRYELSPTDLKIGPEHAARATLSVQNGPTAVDSANAAERTATFIVTCKNERGESHDATAKLYLVAPKPTIDPRLGLSIESKDAKARPGDIVEFYVGVKSNVRALVELHVREASDGISAKIDPSTVEVAPDHPARALLVARVAEDAKPGEYVIVVKAVSGDVTESARAVLYVREPTPPPMKETFFVGAEPGHQFGKPGETLKFDLRVKSRLDQTIQLSVKESPYEAWIEPSTVTVGAGEAGHATLYVTLAEASITDANARRGNVMIVGSNGNESHSLAVYAAIREPCTADRNETAAAKWCEPTTVKPRPKPSEERPDQAWRKPAVSPYTLLEYIDVEERPRGRMWLVIELGGDENAMMYAKLVQRILRLEALLRAHGIDTPADAGAETRTT